MSIVLPEPGGIVPETARERRFLQPGHLIVSRHPMAIATILGSCVAVCLWDVQSAVGGMNHFMLPLASATGAASPRFGHAAMEQLVAGVQRHGARIPSLRAKVYGGASMFPVIQRDGRDHLGAQNADLALAFLRRAGIRIVDRDLGGTRGRKLVFHTDEGKSCMTII